MYISAAFAKTDPKWLRDLLQTHSFATLVTQKNGVPFASHLPFCIDLDSSEHGVLRSHMARGNEQWSHFRDGQDILVIFQGPHAYISPSWYETELMVPTWNYDVVHVYGKPTLTDDAALLDILRETVMQYESQRDKPWAMESLPDDFVGKMLRSIVGFEIEITRIEGKSKMSQNRSEADRIGAINGLAATGDSVAKAVSEIMRVELGGKD